MQSFEVEDKVARALEEDHVTQRGIIEGTVRVARKPQLTVLSWETRIQHAAGVTPHPLPCTPSDKED